MGFSSADALWASREAGALWENHVVNQWVRWRDWHEPSLALWYWRDQGGNEVDLLLERNRKLTAVECKVKEKPGRKDFKGIERLRKLYGDSEVPKAYVACPIDMSYDPAPNIAVVSGWQTWPLEN